MCQRWKVSYCVMAPEQFSWWVKWFQDYKWLPWYPDSLLPIIFYYVMTSFSPENGRLQWVWSGETIRTVECWLGSEPSKVCDYCTAHSAKWRFATPDWVQAKPFGLYLIIQYPVAPWVVNSDPQPFWYTYPLYNHVHTAYLSVQWAVQQTVEQQSHLGIWWFFSVGHVVDSFT